VRPTQARFLGYNFGPWHQARVSLPPCTLLGALLLPPGQGMPLQEALGAYPYKHRNSGLFAVVAISLRSSEARTRRIPSWPYVLLASYFPITVLIDPHLQGPVFPCMRIMYIAISASYKGREPNVHHSRQIRNQELYWLLAGRFLLLTAISPALQAILPTSTSARSLLRF